MTLSEAYDISISLKKAYDNPGIFSYNLKKVKKNIGENILFNNKKIETEKESELIISFFDLELKKEKLKNLWNKLITENDVVQRLKEDFYEYAYEYIPKIKYFLNWNAKERNNFFENIENLGINIEIIFSNKDEVLIEKLRNLPFYIKK